MEVTDRHYRYMMRLLTRRTLLYTEMVVDSTILNARNVHQHLDFSPLEHPVALQLGGHVPKQLSEAAKVVAASWGYDELDLNCGCPSKRVAVRTRNQTHMHT